MSLSEMRISKDNRLVEAGYRLTLNEQRLVLAAIAQVDSRKRIAGPITVHAKDYAATFSLDIKHAYTAIKESADELYERDIRYLDKHKESTRMRWIYKRSYNDGEGSVTIAFSPEIEPYLTILSQKFTSYSLKHVSQFNSVYSIRIYEMLKQYERIGTRRVTQAFLRDRLELEGKYTRFTNIKARVLDPSVEEINLHSDLNVSYEVERKGREVEGVLFSISPNPQQALSF